MYIVSTTLLILTVACSSGTKENKTAEELKKHPKPVVAVSRTIEMHLIRESMADKEILFNSFAHKSQQQRFRPDKPVIVNTENYQHYTENGIKSVLQDPVSTFSIDVDTGSYSNIRRMINQGMLPPSDAIRIEEFINYFDYDYPQQSENGSGTDAPFSINAAIATSPWAEQRHIMRIALKGFTPDVSQNLQAEIWCFYWMCRAR